jgi:hypothetical protein
MPLTSVTVLVLGLGLIAAMAIMIIRARKLPPQPVAFSRWQDSPIWLRVIVIFTVVNFFVFLAIGESHGGTAWNGYKQNGRYFLGEGRTYTEVPRAFWVYSYYHALAVSLCFAALFIRAAYDTIRKDRSKV